MLNLLILLILSKVQAGAGCSNPNHRYVLDASACNRNYSTSEVTSQIHEIQDVVEWWGASTEQVANAHCRVKEPPSPTEMAKVIQSASGDKKLTKSVHGAMFENQPKELVEAFEQLTTRGAVFGGNFNVMDPQVDVQKTYQINPACKSVSCAMEKIWGTELGQKILYLKMKHGYNASELAFDNSSRFSLPEINDVLMSLEDLPLTLSPLGKKGNQRLVPFTKGRSMYGPEEGVLANSGIVFFDSWRRKDSLTRQYTTFHELAHNISSRFANADSSEEWKDLSGWKVLGDKWEKNESACMISRYGGASPAEDFAEVLSAYRYNPNGLKSRCPEKYRYMEDKVFGGVEYTEAALCAQATPAQVKTIQESLVTHLKQNPYPLDQNVINAECANTFKSYPMLQEELETCAFKASLKVIPQERLNEMIKKVGLPVNASTRLAITSQLPKNSPLRSALQAQAREVDLKVKEQISRYRMKALQVKPPARGSNTWNKIQDRCGYVMLEFPEGVTRCFVESLYDEDRLLKDWQPGFLPRLDPPPIFSEKALVNLQQEDRQILEASLEKSAEFQAQLQETKKEFKQSLLSAIQKMKRDSGNLASGWKDLDPNDFCARTYGKSNLFLNRWGHQDGEEVKAIMQECIRLQIKNRRFHPSDDEWLTWINSRWK